METKMLNVVFNTDRDALYYMQGFLKSWEEALSASIDGNAGSEVAMLLIDVRDKVRHLRRCAATRTLHREGGDD